MTRIARWFHPPMIDRFWTFLGHALWLVLVAALIAILLPCRLILDLARRQAAAAGPGVHARPRAPCLVRSNPEANLVGRRGNLSLVRT